MISNAARQCYGRWLLNRHCKPMSERTRWMHCTLHVAVYITAFVFHAMKTLQHSLSLFLGGHRVLFFS